MATRDGFGAGPRMTSGAKDPLAAENTRAYVVKIIMERLTPSAEKAQKDGNTAQQLEDYRLRHGACS